MIPTRRARPRLRAHLVLALFCLAALTACQGTVSGDDGAGGPAGSPSVTATPPAAGNATLEFRAVIIAVTADTPTGQMPASGAPATPQRLARRSDPVTVCASYKADVDTHTDDELARRPSRVTVAQLVDEGKACRQNQALTPSADGAVPADPTAQRAALAALDCGPGARDPLAGSSDPSRPLATCDRNDPVQYILDKTFLTGAEVSNAEAMPDAQGVGYVVTLNFRSHGEKVWGDYTATHVGTPVAYVIDGQVISAPTIEEAIVGGSTRISGGGADGFSQQEAQRLADRLSGR